MTLFCAHQHWDNRWAGCLLGRGDGASEVREFHPNTGHWFTSPARYFQKKMLQIEAIIFFFPHCLFQETWKPSRRRFIGLKYKPCKSALFELMKMWFWSLLFPVSPLPWENGRDWNLWEFWPKGPGSAGDWRRWVARKLAPERMGAFPRRENSVFCSSGFHSTVFKHSEICNSS